MKNFKKISAIIVVIVICLSLCSCGALDELREKHAFFNQNGIIYKDMLYKPVSYSDDLNHSYVREKPINVTDPEVPVLLSNIINWDYSINNDETIITGGYESGWYVREDKYPIYEESIKQGVNFTDIGFEYFDYELREQTDYILSEQERELFLSIFNSEPSNEDFEIYEELYLYEQSDDALFRRSEYYSVIDSDNGYYVRLYDDGATNVIYKSDAKTDEMIKSFFEKGYDIPEYNG